MICNIFNSRLLATSLLILAVSCSTGIKNKKFESEDFRKRLAEVEEFREKKELNQEELRLLEDYLFRYLFESALEFNRTSAEQTIGEMITSQKEWEKEAGYWGKIWLQGVKQGYNSQITEFTEKVAKANLEAVFSDLENLAVMAQQHYHRPDKSLITLMDGTTRAVAGGNNAFDASRGGSAWMIPRAMDTTANGTYVLTALTPDSIVLTGTGPEVWSDGMTPIVVRIVVKPKNIILEVN